MGKGIYKLIGVEAFTSSWVGAFTLMSSVPDPVSALDQREERQGRSVVSDDVMICLPFRSTLVWNFTPCSKFNSVTTNQISDVAALLDFVLKT